MLRKAIITAAVVALVMSSLPSRAGLRVGGGASAATAVKIDSQLTRFFATHAPGVTAPVVITYSRKPGATEFSRLQLAGIKKGFAARELPMVIADMNAAQLTAVKGQAGVVSIYSNRLLKPLTNASRTFIGAPQAAADTEVTKANLTNPGFPISGRGIGIGYVDTGIDATHKDLTYGKKTVQNVIQPLSETVVSDAGLVGAPGVSIGDLVNDTGFVPPIYLENQPMSDVESGHGTHGAGVAAGTGEQSGNFYGGVARGAHLVGVNSGNELGLPLVAIIGAFDYLLVNQFAYNVRVINNSWGSGLDADGLDPDNPINVATRAAHDRNIVVVFAAGNAGDTPTSINPYSTMPWTISVAAGEKQGLGTPAGFSSRGVDNGTGTDVAGMPADPQSQPNLRPDITAPGVDIKSARLRGVGLTNTLGTVPIIGNDLTTIPPAYLLYYTTSQGTSFACPHVSGVVALMLEANPLLTPDEVVTILRQTANPMPFEERVVGAGYADAHNAVRAAMGLAAVPHAFNLFPPDDPNAPQIQDAADDQSGTTAQDIRAGRFAYDAATNQLVYALTVADLSVTTPNMRWTMSSTFGATEVYVTASVDEAATTYEYGKITTLATGTRNQESLGAADSGEIIGNQIVVRLSLDKVNGAVGSDVLNTTSKNTAAQAQILIGTSLSGGLLLNSDQANGSDFRVGPQAEPTPTPTPTPVATPTPEATPTPTPTPAPEGAKFTERYSGVYSPSSTSQLVTFSVRRPTLDAQVNQNHGNEPLDFRLLDPSGRVVATSSNKRLSAEGLAPGNYAFLVYGTTSTAVDYTIKSTQGK
jgi:subtilisin family serine protease